MNEIKPLITNITGIDNEMVKDAPGLKDVMSSLEFSKNTCLVAHNAQFDIPWLLTLLRYNLDIPFSELLCTLKWAKTKEEGKRSWGLSKKYNIGHENAHRALADAVVTKSLFLFMIKIMLKNHLKALIVIWRCQKNRESISIIYSSINSLPIHYIQI